MQFMIISAVVRGRTKTVTETHKSCPSTKSSTDSSNKAPVSINPKCVDNPCSPLMPAYRSQCLRPNLLWRVRPTSRHLSSHLCTEVRPWRCTLAMVQNLSRGVNPRADSLLVTLMNQALQFEEFQAHSQECPLGLWVLLLCRSETYK